MDDNKFTDDQVKAALNDLRMKFFDDDSKDKLVNYEECDIERLRKDDFYCERFLKFWSLDVDRALGHMRVSMKWRKEYGVKDIKESSLSRPLLDLGIMHPYNHDKKGNPVVMTVGKLHKKEYCEDMKKIIVYWVDKVTRENPTKQFTSVLDCSEVSYANMDMELMKFVINVFTRSYPFTLTYYLVYDMPWIFNTIWKVIKQLLPKQSRDRIIFVNKETITDYIDPKCLPTRMGGQDVTEFKYDPEQVQDLKNQYLGNV